MHIAIIIAIYIEQLNLFTPGNVLFSPLQVRSLLHRLPALVMYPRHLLCICGAYYVVAYASLLQFIFPVILLYAYWCT